MIHASGEIMARSTDLRALLQEIQSIDVPHKLEVMDNRHAERIERHYRQLVEVIESAMEEAPKRNADRRRAGLPRASAMLSRSIPNETHPEPDASKQGAQSRTRPPLVPQEPLLKGTGPKPLAFPKPMDVAAPAARPTSTSSLKSQQVAPTTVPPTAPWKNRASNVDDTMPELRLGKPSTNSLRPTGAGEWTIRVCWWNAPLAAAIALAIVVGLIATAVEMVRFDATRLALAAELRKPNVNDFVTRRRTAELLASPLGRFDADRDYLAAVSAWRMAKADNPSDIESIVRFLRRSLEKNPLSVWHRLSLASFSPSEKLAQNVPTLQRLSWNDPEALAALASILEQADLGKMSRACSTRLLVLDPSRTGQVVGGYLEQHIPLSEALEIVPPDIVAVAEVTKLAKSWNEAELRRWIKLQLTQIAEPAPNIGLAGHEDDLADARARLSAKERVEAWLAGKSPKADSQGGARLEPLKAN